MRKLTLLVLLAILGTSGISGLAAPADGPVNLALQAKVSASSEYSTDYAARWAIDGKVPDAEGQDDAKKAWAGNGAKEAGRGEFTLAWPQPVNVAEIVYFGRTGWSMLDTFKDYEVFLDNDPKPAARGTFALKHGPQRIGVTPPREARQVRLKFLNAHGPYNPGASEIAVYSASPSDKLLDQFANPPTPLKEKLLAGDFGFSDLIVIKRHHLSTSHVYTYHAEGFLPGGGLYVYSPATGKLRELVNAGEGEIIDADLSYDGKEILFSWKRQGRLTGRQSINMTTTQHRTDVPEEDWHIFRINVDGTGLTQITNGPSNNLSPCWLPDGGIAFMADRRPAYAYCYVSTSPMLHRMERDGSKIERLSSGILMEFTPCVLNDGRICYTRWEYVDRAAAVSHKLWAIAPDGTGAAGFWGMRVIEPGTLMQTRPIPGTTSQVMCLLTSHNGDPRGGVGIIDITKGGNAQEAIRNLTPEINIGSVLAGNGNLLLNKGPYETPFPFDGSHYLVSKGGSIELRDFDAKFPPARILVKSTDGLGCYSPIPIMPRSRPPALPRLVTGANPEPWATVFLADVYNGLEPQIKRGEIKQICVVEEIPKEAYAPLLHNNIPGASGYAANTAFGYQFPIVSCGATYAPKKIWGHADVEADGSACFKVPANRALYFEALDQAGRAVQRMRTFTHFMPGEQQGCIGCHADRNYATPTNQNAIARTKAPQLLQVPEWGDRRFHYREIVQPVLDRHCIQCHNAKKRPGGVDLSGDLTDFFNVSYEHLARKGTIGEKEPGTHGVRHYGNPRSTEGRNPYTCTIQTINGTEYTTPMIAPRTWGSTQSKLSDLVLAGHPDAAGKPRISLSDAEKRRIIAWIDLNVPYYPVATSKNFRAMGCRRVFPEQLDPVLKEVAGRRCLSCHAKGIPRDFYIRIEKPELNSFLLAPLARAAGGTGMVKKDGTISEIFKDPNDPDYQAILKAFEPTTAWLKEKGREDMPEESTKEQRGKGTKGN